MHCFRGGSNKFKARISCHFKGAVVGWVERCCFEGAVVGEIERCRLEEAVLGGSKGTALKEQ